MVVAPSGANGAEEGGGGKGGGGRGTCRTPKPTRQPPTARTTWAPWGSQLQSVTGVPGCTRVYVGLTLTRLGQRTTRLGQRGTCRSHPHRRHPRNRHPRPRMCRLPKPNRQLHPSQRRTCRKPPRQRPPSRQTRPTLKLTRCKRWHVSCSKRRGDHLLNQWWTTRGRTWLKKRRSRPIRCLRCTTWGVVVLQ